MYPLKLFVFSPITLICTITAVILDIFYFLWLLAKVGFRDEQFFLHYNILSGVDWVGPAVLAYWIPVVGVLLVVLNSLFAWYLYKDHRDLSYIVLFGLVLSHLCLGMAVYMVLFLNV
jgi:hypothetical protein